VLALPDATQAAAGAIPREPPRPRQVLIADDNRDAAESLAMLLELEGHQVTVASSGAEALEHIMRYSPDVALLDIGMPKPDGYEVARQVRSNPACKQLVLVAVTGWGQQGDKLRAREAGFDLHFTKPVEPESILLCYETLQRPDLVDQPPVPDEATDAGSRRGR
jgi:CheY-like chemotaxis protein